MPGRGGFPFDGYEEVLDRVAAAAHARPGMAVLDLGIGTGNLAARLVAQGCTVWGIDFSTEMLKRAHGKLTDVPYKLAECLMGVTRLFGMQAIVCLRAIEPERPFVVVSSRSTSPSTVPRTWRRLGPAAHSYSNHSTSPSGVSVLDALSC